MKRILYLLTTILITWGTAQAGQPVIYNASGTIATGQVITITGANMVNEKTGIWTTSQGSFEGTSPAADAWAGDGSYTTSQHLSGNKSFVAAVHPGGGATCSGTKFYADHIWSNAGPINPGYARIYLKFPSSMVNLFNIIGSGYAKLFYDTGGSALLAEFQNLPSGWPTALMFAVSGQNHWFSLPSQMQPDVWYCLEIAALGSTQQIWWDNTLIGTIHDTQNKNFMQYVSAGIENGCAMNGSTVPTTEFYLDNFNSGTTRRYPSAVIEISGDGVTWKYQPPVMLSDTSIQVQADLSGLTGTNYQLRVTNNTQETSTVYTLSGTPSDTEAPTVPTGLIASAVSSSQINLTWGTSTDNIAVTGYKIYKAGVYLATTAAPPYASTGLSASTLYSYTVSAIDAAGNESAKSAAASATTQAAQGNPGGTVLFQDPMENSSFASRGWYDNTNQGTIVAGGQSGNCLQWAWAQGGTKPTNGATTRMAFTPTESLFITYYVKFQTGWRGSQKLYHPHMMYILSDIDHNEEPYHSLAANYLDVYLEFISKIGTYEVNPSIALQDELNVNTSYGVPPNDLRALTEDRSVAYCNTPPSTGASGDCYADGLPYYYSSNTWKDTSTDISKNTWHKVEVYLKMNSISGGKGVNDGIIQEWIDGVLKIDHSDVLFRTNTYPTMKFAQFVLAPYIGDGSPIAQTMWIDELTVSTGAPATPTYYYRTLVSPSGNSYTDSSNRSFIIQE